MKEKLSRLLDSRKFYLTLSILLAVLYWLVLSMADDSDIEKTIYNVPVQMDYNASVYQSFGLEIIGDEPITVDVTISGPRTVVNDVKADDLLVYPNVNSVTTSGTKTLRLVYSTVNSTARYTISHLSQEMVTLRFDKIITQKFQAQLDNSGIMVEDGYLLDSCVITPAEIAVTGPSEEVSSIAQVWVTMPDMDGSTGLNESKITRGELHLLDEQGNEVDRTLLTLDNEQVEVNINILRILQQQLKVQFTNVPRGFDTSTLGAAPDRDVISVAVPTSYDESAAEDVYPLYINFYELQTSKKYQDDYVLELNSTDEYTLLNNIQQVTVRFQTEEYVEKKVTVSDLRVVNVPEGKKVTAVTEALDSVILVGPPEAMQQIEALEEAGVLEQYVIAQIDASKATLQSGQQMLPVQILVPSISSVFAIGMYSVVVSVE